MATATCDKCGWEREYTSGKGVWLGKKRHLERNCAPDTKSRPHSQGSKESGYTATERALERDRFRLAKLGLSGERTEEEWVANIEALAELYIVVKGLASFDDLKRYRIREANQLRARLSELPLPEQRRIARIDAIRAKLKELDAGSPSKLLTS